MSTFRLSRALSLRTHTLLTPSTLRRGGYGARPISSAAALRYASKQSQDKDSLNPVSTEYSKSGGDDAAAHSDTAFDPNSTRPESEGGKSGAGDGHSLEFSPGNPDVSKTGDAQQGGAQRSAKEAKGERAQSGHGSPQKSGGGRSGGGGGGSA